MKNLRLLKTYLGLILLLAILCSGCSELNTFVENLKPHRNPEVVVLDFYAWYLTYEGNALQEHAYQTSSDLAGEFISMVDRMLETTQDGSAYDPFLCARTRPENIAVEEIENLDGTLSTVLLTETWDIGSEDELSQNLEIDLVWDSGSWKIINIRSQGSGYTYEMMMMGDEKKQTPLQIVEGFYDWYLEYLADPGEGSNLLMDAIHNQSEYLTPGLIQELEVMFLDSSREGYDPFLCMEEIPLSLDYMDQPRAGELVSVLAHSSDPEGSIVVNLEKTEAGWKICSILCPDEDGTYPLPEGPLPISPQGAISGFYGWYIAYNQEQGDPLVAGVYQESEYLAGSLVQKVDAMVQNSSLDDFDPFLCSQEIPADYSLAEVVIEGEIARAVLQTESGENIFTVALSQQDGRWMITDVLCESGE